MGLGDANYNDGSDQANKFNQQIHIISNKIQQLGYNVYNVDAIEALIIISKPYNKNTNYTNDYSIY